MWLKSAPTPLVCCTSNNDSWFTNGDCLINKDNGWPIPPLAPNTATLPWKFNNIYFCIYKKEKKLKITLLLADETLNFLLIFEIKFLLAEFNKHTLTASILFNFLNLF